ncbi:MAG TPA: amidase [Burkholderiales bacterium]|nr:amidase [Burkholderiales bacterium]
MIIDGTIREIAARIRRREVSAVEVTAACLERLARLQPILHCAIRIDAEGAMAAAREADRREPVGPLHGVPLAHKDIFERAGRPMTCGSKILAENVPTRTAAVLRRLDAAGAIDLGTLNMAEFAAGGTGHNSHWGDCVNPWNTAYTPGGSSSGSAAAVAARAVFGSLGTDTGGSVRWPAALCGITGLRPTTGRVTLEGVFPRAGSIDTVGPLARTADDCALLFAAISGESVDLDVPFTMGVVRGPWREDVTDEHAAALEASLAVFRALGASVVDVDLPDPTTAFELGDVVVKSEAAALHATWLRERPGDYAPGIRQQLEAGLGIPAPRYADAIRQKGSTQREYLAAFERVDVLHVAAHPFPAPTMADCAPRTPGAVDAFWAAYPRFTRPFSYVGLPVLALPCGFAASGVPIGCQLVGRPNEEQRLLAAAHAYQGATDWHRAAPKLLV